MEVIYTGTGTGSFMNSGVRMSIKMLGPLSLSGRNTLYKPTHPFACLQHH